MLLWKLTAQRRLGGSDRGEGLLNSLSGDWKLLRASDGKEQQRAVSSHILDNLSKAKGKCLQSGEKKKKKKPSAFVACIAKLWMWELFCLVEIIPLRRVGGLRWDGSVGWAQVRLQIARGEINAIQIWVGASSWLCSLPLIVSLTWFPIACSTAVTHKITQVYNEVILISWASVGVFPTYAALISIR